MFKIKEINKNLSPDANFVYASDNSCKYYNGGLVKVLLDKEDVKKCKNYGWYINKKGYVFTICNNKILFIHRFILNLTNKTIVVDHNDSNKLNNVKHNLILMSNEYNVKKSWHIQKTRDHTKTKVIMYYLTDKNFEKPIKEFTSQKDAVDYLRNNGNKTISQGSISNACVGRRNSAGGFKWRFKNEIHGE